jgi:hypothetical protein
MAAITWSDVVNHAAELASVDAEAQTDILSHVNTALSVSAFEGEDAPKLKLARIYLAAHFAAPTLNGVSAPGPAGPLTSETLDNVSRSYAAPSFSMSSSDLSTTSHGRAYLQLVRNSLARIPRV